MNISKKIADRTVDLLLKLLFTAVSAALLPLVIKRTPGPFVYILMSSLLLLTILVVRDIHAYFTRPVVERLKNEEEAIPRIREIIESTEFHLRVLSKVGTSVFFLFRKYSQILAEGKTIEVLIIDPEASSLISFMNEIYVQQRDTANRWGRLVGQIGVELDTLRGEEEIDAETYTEIENLLESSKEYGYGPLILGSIKMWKTAQKNANQRLRSQEKMVTVHGLSIKAYNEFPDIKAWISDNQLHAVGNYDSLHLGRDNHIDIYKKRRYNKPQSEAIEKAQEVWRVKWEKARVVDINTNSKD